MLQRHPVTLAQVKVGNIIKTIQQNQKNASSFL